MRATSLLVAVLVAVGMTASARPDETELARHLVARAGLNRGICALPRCGEGGLAVAVAESSKFLVHAQDSRPSCVAAAQEAADHKLLLGRRAIVEKGSALSLPYADNSIDLILLTDLAQLPPQDVSLPGGYGSRHRVACGITGASDTIAVVVSQSTGEVTMFKNNAVVLSLPRTPSR